MIIGKLTKKVNPTTLIIGPVLHVLCPWGHELLRIFLNISTFNPLWVHCTAKTTKPQNLYKHESAGMLVYTYRQKRKAKNPKERKEATFVTWSSFFLSFFPSFTRKFIWFGRQSSWPHVRFSHFLNLFLLASFLSKSTIGLLLNNVRLGPGHQ